MGVFKKESDFDNYIGVRVGMLVVEKAVRLNYNQRGYLWSFICKCDCGDYKTMEISDFKKRHYKSCGCNRTPRTTYEYRNHPLYDVWKGMKARCRDKKHIGYKNYGGRGVKVCKEWEDNFLSFYNWSINNGYKAGLQIDKDAKAFELGIDNKLYSPETCRWVTPKENMQSCSRCKLSYSDKKDIKNSNLPTKKLSEIYGVHPATISKIKKIK